MANKITNEQKVFDMLDNASMQIWEIKQINKKVATQLTKKLDSLAPTDLLRTFNNDIEEIKQYLEEIFSVMNAY